MVTTRSTADICTDHGAAEAVRCKERLHHAAETPSPISEDF
jgi:hypothetical protein